MVSFATGVALVLLGDSLGSHLLDELDDVETQVQVVAVERTEDSLDVVAGREAGVQLITDLAGRGDLEHRRPAGTEAEGALSFDVGRVARRHVDVAVVLQQGVDVVLACHPLRDDEGGVGVGVRKVGHVEPEILGDQLGETGLHESIGTSYGRPCVGAAHLGRDLDVLGRGESSTLDDTHQPVHRRPPPGGPLTAPRGRHRLTVLRLDRLCSYMTSSASRRRCSTGTRIVASSRTTPILSDNW